VEPGGGHHGLQPLLGRAKLRHLIDELLVEVVGSGAHRHLTGSHPKQKMNDTPSEKVIR
jgi:hypothetical protein